MNNRLLTDEEIKDILYFREEVVAALPNATETGSDYMVVAKAQDKKTIKYVIDKIEDEMFRVYEDDKDLLLKATGYQSYLHWQSLKEELLNDK